MATEEDRPDEEQPREGDELDEDGPAVSYVHPDDRLWRHPSEIAAAGASAAPVEAPRPREPSTWARLASAQTWVVAVVAGLVGALVGAGVLSAAGVVIGRAQPALSSNHPRTTSTVRPAADDQGLTPLIDTMGPSVFQLDFSGAQGQALGSGVVVGSSGNECYVVTTSSLLADAGPSSQVQVSDYWGDIGRGRTVGTDLEAGLAVVEVALPPCTADAATVGTVGETQPGEEVIAVGSAAAASSAGGPDFSTGYLDGSEAYIAPASGSTNGLYSMMVSTLPLAPSGAGDAVVDAQGNLLGIANPVPASAGQPQLTYVIPIDVAMVDVSALVKGADVPAHAWLGVVSATDISGPGANRLGVQGAVQVQGIAPGSPAARAGIQDGDVITGVDGPVPSVGALVAWLAGAGPGRVCRVSWVHNGRHRSADVTLGTQPASTQVS
ncbi:MAG TPA: trypsin-like peptidase domain-containing protein [Acidimicrobiales bacterium]|nr:trypsin-like peptidase domain-containing protein [Acidimicrobiales bacterium]